METKIKKLLFKTQVIINDSAISQEFKQVAFQEVFRVLFKMDGGSSSESLPLLPMSAKKVIKSLSKISRKAKSSISPAKLVDELIKNNFFNEMRKDLDCIKELDISKGIKVPRNQMASILVRKLRSGKLNREKTEEGYVYFTK